MKERAGNIAAAVLAGGKNSRMGGFNKAFIRINGVPIIEIALAVLKRTFDEIIIVTNTNTNNEFCRDSTLCCPYKEDTSRVIITKDLIKDAGPLGGIHSALSRTSKQAVFFTACDMPFLHNALIGKMTRTFNVNRPEALVPRLGSFVEPLHAIYRTDIKDKLAVYLSCRDSTMCCPYKYRNKKKKDYSVKGFLETVNTRYFNLEDKPYYRMIFKNLNTPQDLKGGPFASKIKSLA